MALVDVPSPMTGSVKEVLCSAGDRVVEGQELILIESMKMEIPIESPATGKVVDIAVTPRQPVTEGTVLARIEAG